MTTQDPGLCPATLDKEPFWNGPGRSHIPRKTSQTREAGLWAMQVRACIILVWIIRGSRKAQTQESQMPWRTACLLPVR